MGTATNTLIRTVRSTGRGSDYYGNCEQCGKACSEHFVATLRRVYRRPNGQHYLGAVGGGQYGHGFCLSELFGEMIDESSLPRDGSLMLVPPAMISMAEAENSTKLEKSRKELV